MVKSDNSLERCSMSQHHQAIDIADCIYVRYIGLHHIIHDHTPGSIFNSGIRKIQRSDICTSSHRHKDFVRYNRLLLAFAGVRHCVFSRFFCDRGYLSLCIYLDALLGETLFQTFSQVCIKTRKYILTIFKYCNLAAKTAEYRCEFKTYHTSSYDAKPLRDFINVKDFL